MKRITEEISFAELMPLIEDSFKQGMTVFITVTGCSMSPLFRHKRDSVTLAPCDPSSLKRGDVPLYRRDNGQYVLHRIVRVLPDTFTLVGDAQTELEIGLPKQNVCAVMVGFTRKGKVVSCSNVLYRAYSWLWMLLRPVRPLLFKIARQLRRKRS